MININKGFLDKLEWTILKKDLIKSVKGISLKDILFFFVFPSFITLLMFLPLRIRESLSFYIYNPKWWQFFTHVFIHKNLSHLWNNLQSYFIFGIIIFIFANKIKEKRSLFLLFLLALISLPLISSTIEILIYPKFLPMIKTSQGSSGLVSAILGFLPMFWIYYFSKKQKTNLISMHFLYLTSSYVVLLFAIIYYQIHKNIFIPLIPLSFILIFSFFYRKNFKQILKGIIKESKENIIFNFLLILIPVFFMIAPVLLFPVKIVQGNSLVDFLCIILVFFMVLLSVSSF